MKTDPRVAVPSDEAPIRHVSGVARALSTTLCVGLSAYALYWVLFIVQPQVYRISFLMIALVLTFLLFPLRRGSTAGVSPFDWVLIAATVAVFAWPLVDFGAFIYRSTDPKPIDVVLGAAAVLLVLEAARRSVGWILPVTAAAFLVYAYAGPQFDRVGLPILAQRGDGVERLLGSRFMTLEGIFGVPLAGGRL
jgi:TRAP-type uncharacterized transport system fused permease subunit